MPDPSPNPSVGSPLRRASLHQPTQAAADIVLEHAAMVRWLGQLQRRTDALQRAHRQQVAALEAELVRLRGQTVALRTAILWGLGEKGSPRSRSAKPTSGPRLPRVWPEASAVICQTGCVGHAHVWLDDQGRCRRTGDACEKHLSGLDADQMRISRI